MRKKLLTSIILTTSILSLINISNTHASEISSTTTPVATSTVNPATSTTTISESKDYEYNGFLYIIDNENNITITKYKGNEINIIIPDEIDGILFDKYKYTLVKYPANKDLKNFSIPDGTFTISSFAFSNCNNLTSITISPNVQHVSQYSFYRCNGIKTVNILADLKKIKGDNKFYCCENIETINTSYFLAWFASEAQIDSLRKNTFYGSNKLTKLNDTDGNTIITLDPIKNSEVKTATATLNDIYAVADAGGYDPVTSDKNNLLATFLCISGSLFLFKSCRKKIIYNKKSQQNC